HEPSSGEDINLILTQPAAKKPRRAPKAKAETGPKKLSAIDAAATVMAEAGEPMDCQTMITTMLRPATTTSSVP
ncbi:MAG TPA: hypothetical protein VGY66_07005, partial [Gemmataceae bacterium]|nr:hypothetical protein [Gemmataceae bacterium]